MHFEGRTCVRAISSARSKFDCMHVRTQYARNIYYNYYIKFLLLLLMLRYRAPGLYIYIYIIYAYIHC